MLLPHRGGAGGERVREGRAQGHERDGRHAVLQANKATEDAGLLGSDKRGIYIIAFVSFAILFCFFPRTHCLGKHGLGKKTE